MFNSKCVLLDLPVKSIIHFSQADQKIMKYMDEKMEIIVGLENTIQKLKMKNKKYNEEKSEVAKQYQVLKQQYLKLVFKILIISIIILE